MDLGIIDKMPRLVCAQAENANPFYKSFNQAMKKGRSMILDDFVAIDAKSTLASAI